MALHILFTALLSIALWEVVRCLPLFSVVRTVGTVAQKAKRTTLAKASDHWKEQAMRAYAGSMFTATAKLFALLLIVAAVIGALVFTGEVILPGFAAFLVAPVGIIAALVLTSLYGVGRARIS